MLIKLHLDEVVAQQPLAYDLLDSQGQVLYHAGEFIESRKLKKFANQGLFRLQEKLPLQWILEEECPELCCHKDVQEYLQFSDQEAQEQERLNGYLIAPADAKPYLSSMFTFWQKLAAGEALDISLLDVLEHQLISEIVSRIDQLQYLNQLRIRDGYTYSHTLDVTAVSIALGYTVGLSGRDLETLALGALFHDLGKLYIPKSIMFKPNRLTDKEFQVMQLHPEIGYRIIREELKLPDEVARPALEHQERHAGGGYPSNLHYDEIHYFSQIVKIADVYDALTSRRPYKESISSYKAIKIMLLEGKESFNPALLIPFLKMANFPEAEVPDELKED